MDVIQLLPDSVANQIAAGEVIQRPASVIKELVENAVDAGAKNIKVAVLDAGKTSIQVLDDGCGMSVTDARLAFERHATSKIRTASDLFSLTTMGFRGEALPSIAAVAQIQLTTRREVDEIGTKLYIAGSRVTAQEPVAAAVGCHFVVDNLFFNVPVRRRFLKSNVTEMNNIADAFLRIALVCPEIGFSLSNNNSDLYNLKPTSLHQRIVDVFGKKLNQDLLTIDVDTTICKIKGFVGKPESAKKKGTCQFFFVNGRFMRHSFFMKSVMKAFERLVPVGMQVPYFIYFTVAPENIDVNIHPTKTEIKFSDENSIAQILEAAVKEAVGRFNDIPSIDFDVEGKPDIPVFDDLLEKGVPSSGMNPHYNPFKAMPTPVPSSVRVKTPVVPDNWEALYEGLNNGSAFSSQPKEHSLFGDELPGIDVPDVRDGIHNRRSPFGSADDLSSLDFSLNGDGEVSLIGLDDDSIDVNAKVVDPHRLETDQNFSSGLSMYADKSPTHYQYKGRFIMTAVKTGLMVVDQERAHQRVLYEKYMKHVDDKAMPSQKVLFPEIVNFPASSTLVLPLILPELENLGFEITDMGGDSYAVNAVPAGIEGLNVTRLIEDVVDTAMNVPGLTQEVARHTARETLRREIYSSMAISIARSAAIPCGQVLSNDEMENLINELFACSNFNYTPDGKKILSVIKQKDIEHILD